MSAGTYAQPGGELLFHWERPRRRRLAIAGFILASLGLHVLCFLLFQVIYPPTIALLPPPARVSVIAPTSPEARTFLQWLAAEDPALASQTQRPAEARAYQLPKLAHVPSYIAVPPQLKELPLPPPPVERLERSASPPGPVPMETIAPAPAPIVAPSTITFSGPLQDLPFTRPELKFRAALRDAPQAARFRVAVDRAGSVRYCLRDSSSGDAALDDQARRALALCRFGATARQFSPNDKLIWTMATIDFGSDLELPPAAESVP